MYPDSGSIDIKGRVSSLIELGAGFDPELTARENIFLNGCVLGHTEKFMKEFGYELHARMIWDKENGIAPAFTVRFSHEYLLWFYKKGKMLKPRAETRGKYTTVLREASTKHSKKPRCAYEMLEDMFPNATKIELFARETRDGWDCFGNEIKEDINEMGKT